MPSSQSPSAETGTEVRGPNGRPSGELSLRRRFVEVARRAEIVGLVNASTSEPELGLRFTEELCEVFDAEIAFVIDEGGERHVRRVAAAVGIDDDQVVRLLKRRELSTDRADGRAASLRGEDVLGVGARSALLAPFETNDGRVALFGVARLHDEPFDEPEGALLEALTLAAGQGLERVWAYEARDRSANEQAALVRASKSMGRSLETADILQTLSLESQRALECDSVAAVLGDEVDGYVVVGAVGVPESFIGFRYGPGIGLGGRAVQEGRTLITHHYREEGYAPPETPALDDIEGAVAVPLRWDGRIHGAVSAGFVSNQRITSSDVELLEGFAELAGLACANAERHAQVREAAEIDGLTGCLNRDALQVRLGELVSFCEQRDEPLSLALLDLDGFKSINDVFGHPSGDAVLKGVGMALRSSVRGGDLVARYGGDEFALILPDASETRAGPLLDRVRAAIRSMEVPGGRLTACVGLAERASGETLQDLLARADEALREAKGSLGPGSVRRARTVGPAAGASVAQRTDSDRRQHWRAVAGDIGLGVARETDPAASAAVAVAELQSVLDLELASVVELLSGGRLEVIAEAGPRAPSPQYRDAEEGSIGRSLREKRPILGDHKAGRREGDIRDDPARFAHRQMASEIAVPVIIGGRAWGAVLCVGSRELDEVDVELVAAVCEHLSASIRTGDLYEQLAQSMIGTAESLAAAMAAKDSYTAGHAHSISELAVEVGRELGLPESALEDLRYGGIFHDIGKIAVPDALIDKAGPLTDEEFEIVKTHPVVGAEILAPVPFMYGVRTIVRHCHEHWDGSGYPDGLKGRQIPLGARIVLAVDAYHAMTSDRPYRTRLSEHEATAELSAGAGGQFDPEVVNALVAVLERRFGSKRQAGAAGA
jgi:diguanylate cyclase (GGDEF)-like protein/putative nucleotidyltransferase with HDIG domain